METPTLLRPTTLLLSLVLVSACGSPAPASPTPSVAPSAPTAAPSSGSPSVAGFTLCKRPAVRVERAAPMLRARTGFDSLVLGDGTVLAVGDDVACLPGPAEPGSETAERYDPAADRWTEAESLNKPRKSFATVGLSDGRALVVGGTNPDDQLYSSTKLFDPTTGSWTDGPLLDVARGDPAAVTLADGRVMVGSVVARGETGDTTTTELLDAGATAWTAGPPIDGFGVLSFIRLTDDRVLAVGFGFEVDVALELFDPAAGTWTPIDGPRVVRQPRFVADRRRRRPGLRVRGGRRGSAAVDARRAVRRRDRSVGGGRTDGDGPRGRPDHDPRGRARLRRRRCRL